MKLPRGLETVIWDFNGTLIDDVEHIVRSVNKLLAWRGLPVLTVASFRDVFGFPIMDYYRRIGLDLSVESMADLSAEFHDIYVPGLMECSLHSRVVETLEAFRKAGVRQFVLSVLEEQLLRTVIEHLGIGEYFTGTYGLGHLEGDSKLSRGREMLDDFGIRPETTILIGDTDHDAEVADVLGLAAILVAQGHQSFERLRATGCRVFGTLRQAAAMSELAPR